MPYILPSGAYYDATNYVNEASVECAPRPGTDYVLADDWQNDPLNPAVCWRQKTAQEIDAEKESRADLFRDIKPAFAATLEIIYENSAEMQSAFPSINAFKIAVRDRLKLKL